MIEIAEQERGIHLNLHLPQLKYEQRKKTGVSTYKAVQTDAQISGPPVQVNHNESKSKYQNNVLYLFEDEGHK